MTTQQAYQAETDTLMLSVLVPVYNTGNLLEPCLHSLVSQHLKNIEFICIDDGSTDGSGAILDYWAQQDKRFKVIHQANAGYGTAMNTALASAKGTWIGIVEPDDTVEPTMFSHLLELAENTTAPIVKGSYTGVGNGRRHAEPKFTTHTPGNILRATEATDYIYGNVAIWSAIYKRDWLIQNNIRFSATRGAAYQDLGFAIRTWLAADSICVTPAASYLYKEDNPASSTRKKDIGAWEVLREFELQEDVFVTIPQEDKTRRSILVRRILQSFQADYRLRITTRIQEYLTAYSQLLNRFFPLPFLSPKAFKKREWHDLQLLYHTPLLYPRHSKGNISILQRLFSCRREGGRRVLRICGLSIMLNR